METNPSEPTQHGLAQVLVCLIKAAYELIKLTSYSGFDATYKAVVKEIAPTEKLAKRRDLPQRLDNLLELLYQAESTHIQALVASEQLSYKFAHAEEALAKAWELASPDKAVYAVPFINEPVKVTEYPVSDFPSLQPPTKPTLEAGDRVRLTIDMPDFDRPFFANDEGVLEEYHGEKFGFRSDRYPDSTSLSRWLNGSKVWICDYCELIPDESAAPTEEISILNQIMNGGAE